MAEPTIAERLIYSTMKLTVSLDGVPQGTGTGFLFDFVADNNRLVPTIITNKHVVKGCDQVSTIFHIAEDGKASGKTVVWDIALNSNSVLDHPNPEVDLCAINIGDILIQAGKKKFKYLMTSLSLKLVPPEDDWQDFDAIEDVIMIGCPDGITDEVNHLPIVRRGISATSLNKDYNGKAEFMVDMACFHGSSGSPIFVYDRNGFYDRKLNKYVSGTASVGLVGILYKGPLVKNLGEITLEKRPNVEVLATMHLGNAIRATELRVLSDEIWRLMDKYGKLGE